MMSSKKVRVLTIGGGSGQFALLSGLRDLGQLQLTAVVSMVDSGGSTGRLRDELGILPPGDILKCILALSADREIARKIFLKKFPAGSRLEGHNAGNMLLTMLSRYTGSFPTGVQSLAEILDAHGKILPVTIDRATLVAELTDGTRIYGERAIDVPRGNQREKIRDVFLVPHHSDSISVYPPVIEAINASDFVIIGPGDLFTSIIPTLIVEGVREALGVTSAALLYVVNIMTKFGETHNFSGKDFVQKLEECLGRRVDGILYNAAKPDDEILARYRAQKAEFVEIDTADEWWKGRHVYACDILDTAGGVVRHDSKKLAQTVEKLIFSGPRLRVCSR
jgi:uncharacterized cofD-like protein